MGRPRKNYFSEEAEQDEHTGLLSDPTLEASSTPPSPTGRYQGLGRTVAPHSRSAPAELCSTPWDGDVDDITPSVLSGDSNKQPRTDYAAIT